MTVLHSGTTKKFSANWGNVFGSGTTKEKAAAPTTKAQAKKEAKPAAKSKGAAPKSAAKPATAKPAPSKKAKAKKK
jgi:hypothetical protein